MIPITIIWLLPVFFMIHDFEEIIMMDSWIKRNEKYISTKFPKIGNRILSQYAKLSTSSFAFAVAIEFLVISSAAFLAFEFKYYWFWMACFIIFSLHLIIHIIQWIVLCRYIPAIITTLLSLFYSIYTIMSAIDFSIFTTVNISILCLISIPAFLIFFLGIHRIAALFEIFLLNFSKNNQIR